MVRLVNNYKDFDITSYLKAGFKVKRVKKGVFLLTKKVKIK